MMADDPWQGVRDKSMPWEKPRIMMIESDVPALEIGRPRSVLFDGAHSQ
ncbi:hypothetical protein [Mesorhizobium sp.]|nr:hypothetical protein [Mesorhizobium sp.]